mmetsp:Transcript_21908/g.32761  ORF Transcript_21908/g.32761 Transcript_21908/m.32761 type:complete len:108 (-) Transcript_21908:73-396(-)
MLRQQSKLQGNDPVPVFFVVHDPSWLIDHFFTPALCPTPPCTSSQGCLGGWQGFFDCCKDDSKTVFFFLGVSRCHHFAPEGDIVTLPKARIEALFATHTHTSPAPRR